MTNQSQGDGFETLALHAGQDAEPVTGAVIPPIFQTSTFAQPTVGGQPQYEYARTANPTRTALEVCLAALEGAAHGIAFASGMAATDTVLRRLEPGDHIVLGDDAYGGTFRLISAVYTGHGVTWSAADLTDLDSLEATWNPATKIVWLETPTNPLLTVIDIEAVAAVAHRHGAKCVVDNTFASPYLQQPLQFGADLVTHSTTKYIGGHSDVVGGFVATNDDQWAEDLRYLTERHRCRSRPPGLLLGATRGQDPGCPDGPPLRERPSNSRAAREPRRRSLCFLSRATTASWSRDRSSPDARQRRNGLVSAACRQGNSDEGSGFDPTVHPRRVSRGRRVAHRTSCRNDACLRRRFVPGGSR